MTARQRPRTLESMRERRDESNRRRNQARQQRWEQQRFAVPYPTDGPKILLGVGWFIAVAGAGWFGTVPLAVVVGVVAGLSAQQVGRSFRPFVDERISVGLAVMLVLASLFGALGLGVGVILGALFTVLVTAGLPSPVPVVDKKVKLGGIIGKLLIAVC